MFRFPEEKVLAESGKEEIEALKRKVTNLQSDLRVENRRAKSSNEAQVRPERLFH